MRDQVRSELVKLRSVRSNLALLGACGAITVVGAVLTTVLSKAQQEIDDVAVGIGIAGLLILVLGVQVIGQEYRFNTIRVTFAQNPRRLRVLAAKATALTVTVTAAAAAYLLLAGGAAALAGAAVGRPVDLTTDGSLGVALGIVVTLVVQALFGLAVGAVVRQPIAGIVAVLIWTFAEVSLGPLLHDRSRWLPMQAGQNLTTLDPSPSNLAAGAGLLYQLAVLTALFVFAATRLRAADA